MTEEEAKTRWCPFVRLGYESGANRWPTQEARADNQPLSRCIASACMAWRSVVTPDFTRRAEAAFRRDGARLSPSGEDIDGRCGLAGAPQ